MRYLYLIVLTVAFMSCNKTLDVVTPDFDVQVEKQTYKVGETVQFNFSGYAGHITFYSGVAGADYNFRERTAVEGGIPQLDVTTQYGGGGTQINSLRLMVSSDLAALTKEGVLAANWTDITDRAIIAPNTVITPSGTLHVSDLVEPGKPLFFAFKFVGQTDPAKAAGNWIVHAFNAKTVLPNVTAIPVASLQNAGWLPFSIKNDANTWTTRGNPAVDLVIIGGGVNAPESEDWYVSKPLYFTKVPPDTGRPIQNIGTNALENYNFVYTQPGTYQVTFVGTNQTVDSRKSVTRQLELTIIE
ncbi:DUF5017 domain-containing protein [Pontibacter sp. 13R65]|uniref:DUF5017 domain-containing protein n=1 Tax=Pontibacter sp. 13R65 TaxID=3127458 RepID=UPI00301E538E